MKQGKILFLVAVLAFLACPAIANENRGRNSSEVPSLDSTNRDYVHNFCAYHPTSPICVIKPNPPARPPFTPPSPPPPEGATIGEIGPVPPPPAECKPATATATVNPGNFRTAVASLGAGKTIVLAPGNYGSLNLSGKSFGGATIQCAQPNACRFSNSSLTNVSNLTIDGIYVGGGNIGLSLKGTNNMTIRCSTMQEPEGTGILIVNNTGYLKLHNNTVYNYKLGCNTLKKSECGHKSDGSLLPLTDYGFRIHNVSHVEALGNRLTGYFNHALSLKERVPAALISQNIFEACGRTCIEVGQEPSTTATGDRSCGQALITGNTFRNIVRPGSLTVLLVKNIHRVTFTGNTFTNVNVTRVRPYTFAKIPMGPSGQAPGQLIGNGVPSDRVITGGG